jgi:predicted O-methyltransferase YrrM
MEQVWTSPTEGVLKGVPFRYVNSNFDTHRTTADEIIVLKPRDMMASYKALGEGARRIVEVGIFEGGSALLFADMFPDATIMAIDWRGESPAIQAHVRAFGYSDRLKLCFNVSQDDAVRVPQLVAQAFGGEQPDLVIDDASHIYGYTTRCFDILYPRLAKGGRYVIEDWGWSYWPGYTPPASFFAKDTKPLSSMIHELVAATAAYRGAIAIEKIEGAQIVLRKHGELPPFSEIAKLTDR